MTLKLLPLACITVLLACATDVSSEEIARAEQQPYEDDSEVDLTAQALGSVETIGQMCGTFCAGLAIGSGVAAVVEQPNDENLAMALTDDADVLRFPMGHRMGTVVASTDKLFYYTDITNKTIRRFGILDNTIVGSTTGEVTGLQADSSWVYWTDSNGLSRRNRDGACCRQQLVGSGGKPRLVLLDGINAYFVLELDPGKQYELRRYNTSDGTNRLVRASTTSLWGFSQDATSIYWVDGGPTFRLRRLTKSSLALSTMRSSSTRTMGFTAARSGVLYWAEAPLAGGTVELMKRASDGAITTERTGRAYINSLEINATHLYWLDMKNPGDPMILRRAPL